MSQERRQSTDCLTNWIQTGMLHGGGTANSTPGLQSSLNGADVHDPPITPMRSWIAWQRCFLRGKRYGILRNSVVVLHARCYLRFPGLSPKPAPSRMILRDTKSYKSLINQPTSKQRLSRNNGSPAWTRAWRNWRVTIAVSSSSSTVQAITEREATKRIQTRLFESAWRKNLKYRQQISVCVRAESGRGSRIV